MIETERNCFEKLLRLLIQAKSVFPTEIRHALRDPQFSEEERDKLTQEFLVEKSGTPWQASSYPLPDDTKPTAESLGLAKYRDQLSDPIEVREYECPICNGPMIQEDGSDNHRCARGCLLF